MNADLRKMAEEAGLWFTPEENGDIDLDQPGKVTCVPVFYSWEHDGIPRQLVPQLEAFARLVAEDCARIADAVADEADGCTGDHAPISAGTDAIRAKYGIKP